MAITLCRKKVLRKGVRMIQLLVVNETVRYAVDPGSSPEDTVG